MSARAALKTAVAEKTAGIVGVTKFPNPGEAPVEVEAADHAAFAKAGPSPKLPGPDGHCAALAPFRLSEPYETPA